MSTEVAKGDDAMGSIYKRGNRLWLCFKDTTGKWRYKSTGLEASQRKKAKDVLDRIEARIAAGKEVGEDNAGAVTVARYAARWIDERKVSGVRSVRDDETRLKHALNHIGDLEIESVRSRHVRNVIRALKRGPLAALLEEPDAAGDELVATSEPREGDPVQPSLGERHLVFLQPVLGNAGVRRVHQVGL